MYEHTYTRHVAYLFCNLHVYYKTAYVRRTWTTSYGLRWVLIMVIFLYILHTHTCRCVWVHKIFLTRFMGFPGGVSGKELACQCSRRGFDPWVGKSPWSREWPPTPAFWPGEPLASVWQATVHWVAKSLTQLESLSMHPHQASYRLWKPQSWKLLCIQRHSINHQGLYFLL